MLTAENDFVLTKSDGGELSGSLLLTTDSNQLVCKTADYHLHSPPVSSGGLVWADDDHLTGTATVNKLTSTPAAYEVDSGESVENAENCVSVSRKRKRNFSLWKHTKCKRLRNSGQQYTSSVGKVVPAKMFVGLKNKCCHKECCSKFTVSEAESIFAYFWQIGNYDAQNVFIAECVEEHKVSNHKVPAVGGKSVARSYARKFSVQTANGRVAVCKATFLSLLGIGSGRVNTVLHNNRKSRGLAVGDRRGKYDHSRQRIAADRIKFVEDHIRSFPVNDSHYTRAHSESRQYLSASLSIRRMYDLYIERCASVNETPVKYWCYRDVFNTKFNLSFHQPRKDTCKHCDMYKTQIGAEQDEAKTSHLKAQHELHLRKAELVRSDIQADKETGVSKPDFEAFTFDLQKVFSLPYISANEAYYCRQLSAYNLGIHSLSTGQAVMNV